MALAGAGRQPDLDQRDAVAGRRGRVAGLELAGRALRVGHGGLAFVPKECLAHGDDIGRDLWHFEDARDLDLDDRCGNSSLSI